jgi:hypothetical protein
MSERVSSRRLQGGQRVRIRVWDRATGTVRTVYESRDRLYEAPNWTPRGQLLVNGDGLLWTLPADGSAPLRPVSAERLPDVNNDHVRSPDGDGSAFAFVDYPIDRHHDVAAR